MHQITRCPECGWQNALGERLCKNCGARLPTRCPKCGANVPSYSRYCSHCNWKDPDYPSSWMLQKARAQSSAAKKLGQFPHAKPQYICPKCGASVDTAHKDCPRCGLLGAMYLATSTTQKVGGAEPTAMSTPSQVRSLPDKVGHPALTEPSISLPQSPLLKEISGAKPREWRMPSGARRILDKITIAEPREWGIPPLVKRFGRPILAALVFGLVVSALTVGGIHILQILNQGGNAGTPPSPSIFTAAQTYTLSIVTPQGGGGVSQSPEYETYTPGTEVTLTATPASGYTFDHWSGDASGSSATSTITMDSNKSVTAYFKIKDTTPPAISDVAVPNTSDLSATITWETNEATTGEIEYWTADADFPPKKSGDEAISHSVRLTGLEPNTTYYFRVKSKDASGNEAASDRDTFITLRALPIGYKVGNYAPAFALPTYQDNNPESPNDGSTVDLKASIGRKKILLDFWSTRCSACLAEFPLIRAIYEDKEWADKNSADSDYAVITVCIDGERTDRIKTLSDKYREKFGPFNFPILLDEGGTTKDTYHIWRIPYTVFIDSDGIIRETKIGRFHSPQEIVDILESL